MRIEQYVMAYGIEQDRIRALLPEGFSSLRPVLRMNAEIREESTGYLEFNTAVEYEGKKGWLNIGCWTDIPFTRAEHGVTFENDLLKITFRETNVEGGCPAEKDNEGCFFPGEEMRLRPPEKIDQKKIFCDCEFSWKMVHGASGISIGKTLPALPTTPVKQYKKGELTVENTAVIPCDQVLGCYVVRFERNL